MTKRIALLGMLIALAFIFSYIESLIPVNLGVPGAKLGLANLVIMIALYTLGERDAFLLSIIRIVLSGFTFGNLASMIYSLGGGMLSFLVMYAAKKSKIFSMTVVSVLGGIFHNAGQILVAVFVLETSSLVYYFPVLAITGIVSGTVIGILGTMITRRLQQALKF